MKKLSIAFLIVTISFSIFAAPQNERLSCEGQAYHSKNRDNLENTYENNHDGFTIGGCRYESRYSPIGWRSTLKANNIIIFDHIDSAGRHLTLEQRRDKVVDALQEALANCGC